MKFETTHYHYVPDFLKRHAILMDVPEVVPVIENGINNLSDAKVFVDFIPQFLDYLRLNNIDAEIADISYEAEGFVDQAGYQSEWDKMIDDL